MNEAEVVLSELKGLKRGKLKISVASTANYFAPQLLATFNQRFPSVTVSLDVTNRQALLQQLNHNEMDMAIMGQPPDGLHLVAESFMGTPLVVIAPDDPSAYTQESDSSATAGGGNFSHARRRLRHAHGDGTVFRGARHPA